jgi:hypothetical protein
MSRRAGDVLPELERGCPSEPENWPADPASDLLRSMLLMGGLSMAIAGVVQGLKWFFAG